MAGFLDVAQQLSKSGRIPPNDVKLVLQARGQLLATHANAIVNYRNLESLFAAFEMAALLGRLGTIEPDVVKELPSALERLIAQTLGATITLSPDPEGEGLSAPEAYTAFAELVRLIGGNESQVTPPVSVLTFNYDPCVDHALYRAGMNPNYCLDECRDDGVSLLKLHGSLNWTFCEQCGKATWWSIGKHLATRRFHRDEMEDMGSGGRLLGPFLQGTFTYACGHTGPCRPLIVPPTYNKGYRYQDIARVWQAAASELAEAENIYVIGFSLPDTDQFFRYFCALALTSDSYLRRFWVFDPEKDGEVEKRFRDWLGHDTGLAFEKHTLAFSDAVSQLQTELRLGAQE